MSVYQGGIPSDGVNLYPKSDSEGQEISTPTAGPSEEKMSKVGLGSTESNGYTGKDINPPAEGEETIASRKVVSNQPV